MLTGVFNALISILLHIDVVIYSLIGYLFQVFIFLANESIFTEDTVKILMDRVYVVVGVVSLFLLAFSLLQSLVNPDDLTKGKNSPVKIIKNVLISLALLGFTPVIFNFAYEAQNRIINSQILSKLILGGDTVDTRMINCKETEYLGEGKYDWEDTQEILKLEDGVPPNLGYIGNSMAVNLFSSFFYGEGKDGGDYYGKNIKSEDGELDFFALFKVALSTAKSIVFRDIVGLVKSINENIENVMEQRTLCSAYEYAKIYGDFDVFNKFSENTLADKGTDGKINYTFIVSTIAGGVTLYFLFSFCIGLAVRAVKLGYYQLIAPIPILARIVPQGQKIFDNWLKGVLSTFAEVFIRLLVVFFTVFMIETGVDVLFGMFDSFSDASLPVLLLAKALLIIGILIFAKKAPSFITDMIGIKSGSLKLGIKDQIREAALIGKPIATTMDKAQGFITGSAGGAWSAIRHGGNIGSAIRTGAIAGAAKGGNQFGAQRDAAYHRISGEEGADTIWGNYERWAKGQVKAANKAAKEYHTAVINGLENSNDFVEAVKHLKEQMLNTLLERQDIKDRKNEFINGYRQNYVDAEQTKYVNGELDKIKEKRDSLLNEVTSSMDYINTKNRIQDELAQQGIHLSDADLQKRALDEYNQTYNGDNMDKYRELQQAMNLDDQKLEAMRTTLSNSFDRKAAEAAFDSSSRYKDLENQFNHDIELEERIDSKAYNEVVDAYKAANSEYKAAKTYMKDATEREGNKKMADVLKAAIKDNKLDLGGGSKPDASSSKDDSKK